MIEKLDQYRWLWRKQRQRKYAFSGALSDPTSGQGRIVALLKITDGISTRQITTLFGTHFSTTTQLIEKLEKDGYVVKKPSPEDKRVQIVKLTGKGKALEQDEQTDDITDTITACLSEAERKTFCGYLDRIIDVLQNDLGMDAEEAKVQMQEWRERKQVRCEISAKGAAND
jgi:DNA-binding MarR family transcriptional regulator